MKACFERTDFYAVRLTTGVRINPVTAREFFETIDYFKATFSIRGRFFCLRQTCFSIFLIIFSGL